VRVQTRVRIQKDAVSVLMTSIVRFLILLIRCTRSIWSFAVIPSYSANQLQEDLLADQITIKKFYDPFTGELVNNGKK
jgi:hypothetical protein